MRNELILENLHEIEESIRLIENRFSKIDEPDEFVDSMDGILILDAICMRLQIIGELLKKVHKIDQKIYEGYHQVEWPKIMKLRDIISHHYEHVDHEIIYDICKNHIPDLSKTVLKILADIETQ